MVDAGNAMITPLKAVSDIVPLNVMPVESKSKLASSGITVYVPEPCAEYANGPINTTAPVSNVTESVPFKVTISLKLTVTLIKDPMEYAPFGVVDVIFKMEAGRASTNKFLLTARLDTGNVVIRLFKPASRAVPLITTPVTFKSKELWFSKTV